MSSFLFFLFGAVTGALLALITSVYIAARVAKRTRKEAQEQARQIMSKSALGGMLGIKPSEPNPN